jgi:opacity protein-like surface antigen
MRTGGNSNVSGWTGQVAFNANHWFGFAADFSGRYQTESDSPPRLGASVHSFLFGPQVYDRAGRVTGFAHALFGGAKAGEGFRLVGGGLQSGKTCFAMAFGGGIDVNVNEKIAVRVFQADFEKIRAESALSGETKGTNNFRLSIGVVFKFPRQ